MRPRSRSASGAFTQLSPGKLAEVLAGVGTAIDAMGGSFTMRYTTVAVTAARAANRELMAQLNTATRTR